MTDWLTVSSNLYFFSYWATSTVKKKRVFSERNSNTEWLEFSSFVSFVHTMHILWFIIHIIHKPVLNVQRVLWVLWHPHFHRNMIPSPPNFPWDSHWWNETQICKNSPSENEFPIHENLLVKLIDWTAIQPITAIWPTHRSICHSLAVMTD